MDAKKQKIIDGLSEKIKDVPKEDLLPFFLALQQKLKKENITFTKEELQEVLKLFEDQASETEKKQLRLILELMNQ